MMIKLFYDNWTYFHKIPISLNHSKLEDIFYSFFSKKAYNINLVSLFSHPLANFKATEKVI